MKLRVYPGEAQGYRAGTWLFQAHRFRNEAVAYVTQRRGLRAAWLRQHPALARDGLPPELAGSDTSACSLWLTARLEAARDRVRLEGGVSCSKRTITQAVAQMSRGERESLEDAWLLALPRTVLDQVLQDLKKTIGKAIKDRTTGKKLKSGARPTKTVQGPLNAAPSIVRQAFQKAPKTPFTSSLKRSGFPTFRRWQHATSVRLQVNADQNAEFKNHWLAGELYVPGLGRLRFRDAQALPKTPPKLITLSRNAADQWHVSFVCAAGEGLAQKHQAKRAVALPLDEQGLPKTVGLDLSLTSLAIDHDGKALGRERYLKKYQKKLTRRSQQLSRKTRGSRRWQKAARHVGKLHVRVANARSADLQAKAQALVQANAIVCLEDFPLAFMLQNPHLSASTHDAGWATFKGFVYEEAAKYGRLVLTCGRFDASSKTCSCCGYVNQGLKLNDRTWTCPGCDVYHHRDTNAAVNVRRMTLQKAIETCSPASETDAGTLSQHRLNSDLEGFLARGGLTALRDAYASRQRHVDETPSSTVVPGLTKRVFCQKAQPIPDGTETAERGGKSSLMEPDGARRSGRFSP